MSKNKRRSQSVENAPEPEGFGGGGRMFHSQSNQNVSKQGNFQSLKAKTTVLNRPGTIGALSALSNGGFSQNISANALRNAHSQWSFGKADRFKKLRINNSAKMLALPNTLNTKTSTFGFGEKKPLQIIFGKDSPPPSLYRSRSQFDYTPGAGKSMGIPYSAYKKVHMPGLNTRLDEIPGPGSYEQKTSLGANSRKFSLKSRIKPADSATRDNPPPNNYSPNFGLTERSGFDDVGFGFGSRPNVTGRINENPGPGAYRAPSIFDKFKNIPNPSLLKTLQKYRKKGRRKIPKPQYSERSSTKQLSHQDDDPLHLALKNEEDASHSGKDGSVSKHDQSTPKEKSQTEKSTSKKNDGNE
ncbi:unnamed protein product [Moneuplotes crassus]|uniref:Uncharacterized protein n=1 Tax=Euplotes crassus TaxID=5936 RepID=A0AAD2CXC5_EUPCR|nr:unnamed protein product [Moneuplotes crassus]